MSYGFSNLDLAKRCTFFHSRATLATTTGTLLALNGGCYTPIYMADISSRQPQPEMPIISSGSVKNCFAFVSFLNSILD